MPSDLALESRDCLQLFDILLAQAESLGLADRFTALNPEIYFADRSTSLLRQADIIKYEAALKVAVHELLESENSKETDVGQNTITALAPIPLKDGDRHLIGATRTDLGEDLANLLSALERKGDLVSCHAYQLNAL